MNIEGWKYYNHAAIPTCAPHEEADLKPLEDGSIWKMDGFPLLARWTTDWDCGYETNWWYVIKDTPFNIASLSKKARHNIHKALENCFVSKINPMEYREDLWRVFQEAILRYRKYELTVSKEEFLKSISSQGTKQSLHNHVQNKQQYWEYWAGFSKTNGLMIGYKICIVNDNYVEFSVGKYSTPYLNLRVSDAMNFVILDEYLNNQGKKYVTEGSRSIYHETNVQEYYQEKFKFRKAFCKLHVKYRFSINVLIKLLYPIRGLLRIFDYGKLHAINSLLKMEEIKRNC